MPNANTVAPLLLFLCAATFAQTVNDPNLKVQRWAKGLDQPTGVAFVDNGATALVLEKSTGRVRIVRNRSVTGTALDLSVANDSERGLLGIALGPGFGVTSSFVYVSYTRAANDGGDALDHRVDRYRWLNSTLVFDRRVLVRPATPGPNHDGGKIAFGPDNKLYVVAGDLNRNELTSNFENSSALTATASILRVNPSGSVVPANPFFGNGSRPRADIFAYGIRNSFGLAFDPVTGNLWDTENGPDRYDEINRVTPGFNSGWEDIMGPTSRNGGSPGTLASLGPAAHYEDPKLSWKTPVAPTDAFFMDSARLGKAYAHDLFVGTVLDGGVIYDINLTHTRKALQLSGPLSDGVADNASGSLLAEQSGIVFGTGFGVVTDIQSGPGGLYVTSLTQGSLFRITDNVAGVVAPVPEPRCAIVAVALAVIARRRHRPRAGTP